MFCLRSNVLAVLLSLAADLYSAHASEADTRSKPSCIDDPTYGSKLGLDCSQHIDLPCDNFRKIGFTDDEVTELLVKCPSSCGVAPCTKPTGTANEKAADNEVNGKKKKIVDSTINEEHVLPTPTLKTDRSLQQQQACYPGWEASCQDNPDYHTRLHLKCEMHVVVDCKVMTEIGFTDAETDELINICPCSCGIECGTWTAKPTMAPTPKPSPAPTAKPTNVPTDNPTFSPTSVPTTSPTPAPSPGPTNKPTPGPTVSPTTSPTGSPTIKPSPGPTVSPTTSPTGSPTIKPSPGPTVSPTTSPTASPTDTHSTAPSRAPTPKPTSSPSFVPTKIPTAHPTISNSPTASSAPSLAPTISAEPANTVLAIARAEGFQHSADGSNDDVAPWIVYSSAAAVGVAVAAIIIGLFLVKSALGRKGTATAANAVQLKEKANPKRCSPSPSLSTSKERSKSRASSSRARSETTSKAGSVATGKRVGIRSGNSGSRSTRRNSTKSSSSKASGAISRASAKASNSRAASSRASISKAGSGTSTIAFCYEEVQINDFLDNVMKDEKAAPHNDKGLKVQTNVKSRSGRPSSPLSRLFSKRKQKKSAARAPANEAAGAEDLVDEDDLEVINLNDDEFEVALPAPSQQGAEDDSTTSSAANVFTSIASVLFKSNTDDYYELDEEGSLPSRGGRSTTTNNTFTTFFQHLDIVVNDAEPEQEVVNDAEPEQEVISPRMEPAMKQISDITMSMHPTKLVIADDDDESSSKLTGLPMLGLSAEEAAADATSRKSYSTRSRRSDTSRSRASYNEASNHSSQKIQVSKKGQVEAAAAPAPAPEKKKKKTPGIFKLFMNNGAEARDGAMSPVAEEDEKDIRLEEMSAPKRSDFLNDLKASDSGTFQDTVKKDRTKATGEGTVEENGTTRRGSLSKIILDEDGSFSVVGGEGTKKSVRSKATKSSQKSRLSTHSSRSRSRPTEEALPHIEPFGITKDENPIANAKNLLEKQGIPAAAPEPVSDQSKQGSKQGSKSGKIFFACGGDIDDVSTFSKSTLDHPMVYREEEIVQPPADKAKVSSLLNFLSLNEEVDNEELTQTEETAAGSARLIEAVPGASGSIHLDLDAKSQNSQRTQAHTQRSSKSRQSQRPQPANEKDFKAKMMSLDQVLAESGEKSIRSSDSHDSRLSRRSSASMELSAAKKQTPISLDDILAVSDDEESVASNGSGTLSGPRLSSVKGLEKQGSVKMSGSSVKREASTARYSTSTARIDNTSLRRMYPTEAVTDAPPPKSIKPLEEHLNHITSKDSNKFVTRDNTFSTFGTYRTSNTGHTTRGTHGTDRTMSTREQKSYEKKRRNKQSYGGVLKSLIGPLIDDASTFSHSTAGYSIEPKRGAMERLILDERDTFSHTLGGGNGMSSYIRDEDEDEDTTKAGGATNLVPAVNAKMTT